MPPSSVSRSCMNELLPTHNFLFSETIFLGIEQRDTSAWSSCLSVLAPLGLALLLLRQPLAAGTLGFGGPATEGPGMEIAADFDAPFNFE